MKLLEMTVKQNGHQLGLHNQKFPASQHIFFSPPLDFLFVPGLHNTKCLASLDFLFLGICCFARATWQHFLLRTHATFPMVKGKSGQSPRPRSTCAPQEAEHISPPTSLP
ncbi:uncharacterized protein [Drosophila takahashii]|uniref:uncharacterized protein n=1 Tax=Drosophila takahashii TaxID=29030 RepID=UPI00389965FA